MTQPTGAETVRWNLDDLYTTTDALERTQNETAARAEAFHDTYHGRVSTLSQEELLQALREYGTLQDEIGRAFTYAYLNWSTDTSDAARGRLLQRVREAFARFAQQTVFFEVEWAAIPAQSALPRLQDSAFDPYRHYLELATGRQAYMLSEEVEKVLAEVDVTGRSAWVRLFDEILGRSRFEVEEETLTEQEVLARLHAPDRDAREAAAIGFTEGLVKLQPELTYIFNTVLADKAAQDRLRGYESWLSSRNLSNEVPDATVEALVEAVTSRYDIAQRFYHLKRDLLGFDTLYDYDRYAPLAQADRVWQWEDARDAVLASYSDFDSEMGTIVRRFFEERWIDAPATPGKRGGAFSHGAVPSAHPYILLNYTGRTRDVQTLAHELGHGVHQYLSREQGVFHAGTPLTTAETASVFGEMLTFQRLLKNENAPEIRLSMLVGKIDDSMATVFRQVSMNRFENSIHTARQQEGELPAVRFGELWMETQHALYGDSVTLGDHYAHWWSYIPHFLHTPGYVYAYAFGELLVLALYARYQDEGPGFARRYSTLLRAGGSDWPHRLVAPLGVDLEDPAFWSRGLDALDALVKEAEGLAATVANPGS